MTNSPCAPGADHFPRRQFYRHLDYRSTLESNEDKIIRAYIFMFQEGTKIVNTIYVELPMMTELDKNIV